MQIRWLASLTLLSPQAVSSALLSLLGNSYVGSQFPRKRLWQRTPMPAMLFLVWQRAWWHLVRLMLQHHTPGLAALKVTAVHYHHMISEVWSYCDGTNWAVASTASYARCSLEARGLTVKCMPPYDRQEIQTIQFYIYYFWRQFKYTTTRILKSAHSGLHSSCTCCM